MPPLKPLVTATSKAQFIRIPPISSSCSYRGWLHRLTAIPHNRKVFLGSDKDIVDSVFQMQAAQQFIHDNNKLKQAMNEVSLSPFGIRKTLLRYFQLASKSSKEAFEIMQSVHQNRSKTSDRQPVDLSHDLSIPAFSKARGTQNRNAWKAQTYERFAQQFERQNPNTVPTKHMVDTAFRAMVSRLPSAFVGARGREEAVSRVSYNIGMAVEVSRLTISVSG